MLTAATPQFQHLPTIDQQFRQVAENNAFVIFTGLGEWEVGLAPGHQLAPGGLSRVKTHSTAVD